MYDINQSPSQTPVIFVQEQEVHEPLTLSCNNLYQEEVETDINYVSDDQLLPNKTVIGNVDIEILSKQLTTVIENQNKLFREVAKIQTTLEYVIKNQNNASTTRLANKVVAPIEPINSLDELKVFDEKLKQEEVFEGYTQSLSFICGRNGKGKGLDHCYMLVDKMFTRNFFTLCSWAGGSKIPKSKFAFKFFEHTISLFFKIVNLADNSFCLEDCEEFFKNVIRNSMRRNQTGSISGTTRTSKSKNRPKKIPYNGPIATPNNETLEGEDSDDFNQNPGENPMGNVDDKADPGHQAVVVEMLHE